MRMLLLLWFSCLLVASNVQAEDVDDVPSHSDDESKKFWKLIFTTYYDIKGLRNKTTDDLVESFFEHEFEAYPQEVYPVFKRIFSHISKSNDRIWNSYESILYLYHNVEAADCIYETILRRLALSKMLKESGELDLDAAFPLEGQTESSNFEDRLGGIHEEALDFDQPCEDCGIPPLQVGSIRAIPGVHFPNYDEIPISSFTCAGKHIPGFYADLETGCQVFHVCYPHRRESFLCPIGTTFNQAILACDYWYSSNCSLAPLYFISDQITLDDHLEQDKDTIVDHLLEHYDVTPDTFDTTSTANQRPIEYHTSKPRDEKSEKPKSPKIKITLPNIDWTLMIKFLPIKSKITEFPEVCDHTSTRPTKSTPITEPYEDSSTRSTVTPVPHKKEKYTTPQPVVFPTVATLPPKKHRSTTTSRPVVSPHTPKKPMYTTTTPRPVPPLPSKKDKFEKTGKSEILLDILKAVKMLTKDAEGFLSKIVDKKSEHEPVHTKKPNIAPRVPLEQFQEINPRFVVKPIKVKPHMPRPTVTRSKSLKPSKHILKPNTRMQEASKKVEPAKLLLDGMKALSHLFD